MKKYILLFFVSAFSFTISAQVEVSIVPNLIEEFVEFAPEDWVGHAVVVNESNETKTYKWVREIVCNGGDYLIAVCDKWQCHGSSVSENEFSLEPNEEGTMDVHIYDATVAEGALVHITVTEVDNPENTTLGIFGHLTCNPSAIENLALSNISVFPNPTSDQFRLSEMEGIDQLTIYNIVGNPMKTYDVSNSQIYSVSDLPVGLYLIQLTSKEGQTLKTLRLTKR